MAAVISLQRFGDSFSSYYGEFTRMQQDKVTSLEAQSQVNNMVELGGARWSAQSTVVNLLTFWKGWRIILFHSFPKQFLKHRL